MKIYLYVTEEELPFKGQITATTKVLHKGAVAIFYIASAGNRPLLSNNSAKELRLITNNTVSRKQETSCMTSSQMHEEDANLFTGVGEAENCQTITRYQLIQMSTLPGKPWSEISIDCRDPSPAGEYLMVVMDKYSRFPLVEVIKSTSAGTVIPHLDRMFSVFGVPEQAKQITDLHSMDMISPGWQTQGASNSERLPLCGPKQIEKSNSSCALWAKLSKLPQQMASHRRHRCQAFCVATGPHRTLRLV